MANTKANGECQFSNSMYGQEKRHFWKLFWTNKHATIAYCSAFWCSGVCIGFLGPTLWDLGCQTGTTLSNMTWLFFAQSLFNLIGNMVGGVFKHRSSNHKIMVVCTCIFSLTFLIIPFCNCMLLLALVLAGMGFCMGIVDTCANVCMIGLYGMHVSPFLQALYFFHALGAFLSPMIAEPFLQRFDCTKLIDNSTIRRESMENNMQNEMSNKIINEPLSLEVAQKTIRVQYAFWIMAIVQIPAILLTLSLVFRDYTGVTADSASKSGYEEMEQSVDNKANSSAKSSTVSITALVVTIACVIVFFSDGMQAACADLLFTYARMSLEGISVEQAAELEAVFWGMFASGRLISICAALYFAPGVLLCFDIVGTMVAMLVLILMPQNVCALFLGTAMFGLFLASVCPSIISLTEHFVQIGPTATSALLAGAGIGEMVYPVAIGNLMTKFGSISFMATGNASVWLMAMAFGALWTIGTQISSNKTPRSMLTSCCPWLFGSSSEKTGLLGIFPISDACWWKTGTVTIIRYSRMDEDNE